MAAIKETRGGVDHYRMFIHGEWVDSASGGRIDVENPASEEVLYTVPDGGAEEARSALESARSAAAAWAACIAVAERSNGA